jgi:Icc-related predicted phosphoesterase
LPDIPPCDLFLLAGDVTPYDDHSLENQARFLDGPFRTWMEEIPAKEIVWIAGNHDFLLQRAAGQEMAHSLPGHFLLDSSCQVLGLNIWGTPWIPSFADWAFELEEDELGEKFSRIEKADILLSHGPPRGIADRVGHMEVGSVHLRANMTRADLVVCGHVHEGRGFYNHSEGPVLNASYIDERYKVVGLPPAFDWDDLHFLGLDHQKN